MNSILKTKKYQSKRRYFIIVDIGLYPTIIKESEALDIRHQPNTVRMGLTNLWLVPY